MNKDVIYIEPEDDITNVITKIENAKSKIVALVPPKKSGVLKSIINLKLIAKSAATADKTVVLVTTDDSIVKLAATTQFLVTKDLQSAPAIPELTDSPLAESEETTSSVVEENPDSAEGTSETPEDPAAAESPEEPGEEDPKNDKKSKKKSEKELSNNPFIRWFQQHKKLAITLGIILVVLILVLVWAFVIAPAVDISIKVGTESQPFSENVSFTTDQKKEDSTTGVFYIDQKKNVDKQEVTFKATGTKNTGNKASGTLTVSRIYGTWAALDATKVGSTNVPTGSTFTYGGLNYIVDQGTTLTVNEAKDCDGYNGKTPVEEAKVTPCVKSADIKVTASGAGQSYNISGTKYDWSSSANLDTIFNSTDIAGGTDNIITVVQQSDVEAAKAKLSDSTSEEAAKEKLLSGLSDDELAIKSSFSQTTSAPTSTPGIDEEVASGVTPVLTVTTTSSVYYISAIKAEEFIKSKAKLESDQKVYSVGSPYVENFTEKDSGFTGKLKTTYYVGPKVSEEDVLEKVKGKKIGEAQAILKSISGVKEVSIVPSFFWVSSVPNDPNKITINVTIEDQEKKDNDNNKTSTDATKSSDTKK